METGDRIPRGGYLDTIREGLNGVFIEQPTSEQIEAAIQKFNPEEWDKQAIKNYIARFSEERFYRRNPPGG